MGAIVTTLGCDNSHIILRGGSQGPNYSAGCVSTAASLLAQNDLTPKVIVDCSHDNSNKDYRKQAVVVDSLCQQLQMQQQHIMGLMLESNLVAGKQSLQPGGKLKYGQSITDGCVDWSDTENLLKKLASICK